MGTVASSTCSLAVAPAVDTEQRQRQLNAPLVEPVGLGRVAPMPPLDRAPHLRGPRRILPPRYHFRPAWLIELVAVRYQTAPPRGLRQVAFRYQTALDAIRAEMVSNWPSLAGGAPDSLIPKPRGRRRRRRS